MALATGIRIGGYEILGSLGEGGMGEVYRARDTKLKRDVALKVLPQHFTSDADRLARFQREAEVLATLNHPNIAHIHGLEETGSVRALVMELVDGEDLAARLTRGPIPLDEALPIARQIAEALEAAHEQGIIHRDLKPANIKVRSDGTVKVLDFGLAKAMEPGAASAVSATSPGLASLANSPTITSPALTLQGMLLGTAAYMSPEQAKGRPADKRSDIWAFGCVLYEMLTARRAFEGDDVSDTLANVLKSAPDWSRLPPETPPPVVRLLRRCLTKDRRQRLADMADARLELDAAADEPVAAAKPSKTRSLGQVWRERVFWAAAVIAGIVAATLKPLQPPADGPPEMRLDIVTPPSSVAQDPSVALSPDGQSLALVADHEKRAMVWVRSLRFGTLRPLPGTEGARFPFWSSDGRSIGFFTAPNLKIVDVDTSSVRSLATVIGSGGGGTWHGETILYSPNSSAGPLYRVSPTGGTPVQVTKLDPAVGGAHRNPTFLPDGRHFLFLTANQIFVGDLDGGPQVSLLAADAGPVYAGSGHLLFVRRGTLMAQPFDPDARAIRGTPEPVAEQVAVAEGLRAAVSASASGALVYRTGVAQPVRQFVWFDRTGVERQRIGTPELNQSNPELSPDGSRLALQRNVGGNADIWFLALARGAFSRFTTEDSLEAMPVWSPDGSRMVFTSTAKAGAPAAPLTSPLLPGQPMSGNLWVTATDGSRPAELLIASPDAKWPTDWSPDGRLVLYRSLDATGTHDTWVVGVDGATPLRILGGRADERDAQFSPDGRWIVFQSDESGRSEIYIQRFPGPGGKERISAAGGTQARWRKDGREIFYVTLDNELAAVRISLPTGNGPPDIEPPQILFTTSMVPGGVGVPRQQYAVAADGQRFLINTREARGDPAPPITLLLNWRGPQP